MGSVLYNSSFKTQQTKFFSRKFITIFNQRNILGLKIPKRATNPSLSYSALPSYYLKKKKKSPLSSGKQSTSEGKERMINFLCLQVLISLFFTIILKDAKNE